jgi:lipopolysaccharide/colanic/teichoic acid biosynthesis glycosyltransferase
MYRRFGKRVFDLTAAAIGLVVLALPMGIIAILVRATSRGPALFRQTRVGREGKLFTVRKFRTMSTGHGNPSPVTVRGDSRITGVGGVMRRFKIDEYPQLWNVLGYCDKLEGEARRILDLRPGITGPATIKYADEEEILAAQADPVRYNDEVIFPDKVWLNLEYLKNYSFRGDLGWIWKTLTAPFASKSDI